MRKAELRWFADFAERERERWSRWVKRAGASDVGRGQTRAQGAAIVPDAFDHDDAGLFGHAALVVFDHADDVVDGGRADEPAVLPDAAAGIAEVRARHRGEADILGRAQPESFKMDAERIGRGRDDH